MKKTILFFIAIGLVPSVSPAQSFWQKLKQQAQEAQRQAKTRPSQTPAAPGSANAQRAARPTADSGPKGTPQLTNRLAASMPGFTVAGIKLGMSVKGAMSALKAHNSILTVSPHPITFKLIPNQQLLPDVAADEPITGTTPHEEVHVNFTMAPNAPVVDGIVRTVFYPKGTEPPLQKAADAMKAAYGDPSISPKTSAQEPEFEWFYDTSGKLLSGSQVAYAPQNCDINAIDGAPDIISHGYQDRSDFEGERHGETCGPYTVLIVRLQLATDPTSEKVVTFMYTSAVSGPLYRSAAQATHAQYVAAQQVKDQKDENAAQQNKVTY
jgi:hypothetical protein